MQQDLCEAGSLVFFEQNEDALPEPNEADQMIETGDADFHYMAETVLGVLYATGTLPIRRSALNRSNHKTLAGMIVLMMNQCCQVELDEYHTIELKTLGYSSISRWGRSN